MKSLTQRHRVTEWLGRFSRLSVPLCLCVSLVGLLFIAAPPASAEQFAVELEALAKKCEELKLPDQAAITRRWIIPRHSGRQYFFVPEVTDPTAPPKNAPQVVKQWHAKFMELRRQQAGRLLAQAKQELDAEHPAQAYRLLFEVLHEDPDHAEARRILGCEKLRSGHWASPYGKGATAVT